MIQLPKRDFVLVSFTPGYKGLLFFFCDIHSFVRAVYFFFIVDLNQSINPFNQSINPCNQQNVLALYQKPKKQNE